MAAPTISTRTRWSSAAWLSTLLSLFIVASFSGFFFVRYQEARKAAVERSVRLLGTGAEALRQAANGSTELLLGQPGCENGISISIPAPESVYPTPRAAPFCIRFEQLIDFIPKHRELFDKSMLVEGGGSVLEQSASAAAPNLLALDTLTVVSADGKTSTRRVKLGEIGPTALVEAGSERFQLFCQPLSRVAQAANGSSSRLHLCGMVSDSRMLRDCLAVSPLYVVALSGLLALVLLLPPFIRTAWLSYSQRFRFFDAVTVGICIYFWLMLVTLLGEGVYSHTTLTRIEKDRLEALALKVAENLKEDFASGESTLLALRDQVLEQLPAPPSQAPDAPVTTEPQPLQLAWELQEIEAVAWADVKGSQRAKWSRAGGALPSETLAPAQQLADVSERPYFKRSLLGNDWAPPVIDSIKTFTTGQTRAVFATRASALDGRAGVLTLTTSLSAMKGAKLPDGLGFAVVGQDGRVAFHSDDSLSNSHNLLDESQDNADLRRALLGNLPNEARWLESLDYWGIDHLAYVGRPNNRWSVVTFEEAEPLRRLVFRSMVRALRNCAVYTLCCSALLALALVLARRRLPWPDLRRTGEYVVMVVLCVVTGAFAFKSKNQYVSLGMPFLLATMPFVAILIGKLRGKPDNSPGVVVGASGHPNFFPIAASLLLLVATSVPAHALAREAALRGEQAHDVESLARWLVMATDLREATGETYAAIQKGYMNAWRGIDLVYNDWSIPAALSSPGLWTAGAAFVVCMGAIVGLVFWSLRTLFLWGVEASPSADWQGLKLDGNKGWLVVPSRRSFDSAKAPKDKAFVASSRVVLEDAHPPTAMVVFSPRSMQQLLAEAPAEVPPAQLEKWTRSLVPRVTRYLPDPVADEASARAETRRLLPGAHVGTWPPEKADWLMDELSSSVEVLEACQQNLLEGSLKGVEPREVERRVRDACWAYYLELWNACTAMERLTLLQLAEEGFVNQKRIDVVRHLMARGLVLRRPMLAPFNDTFALFVRATGARERTATLESRGDGFSWDHLKAPLITLFVCAAGAFFYTQRALFDTTLVFATTLTGVLPHLGGWLSALGIGPAERIASAASNAASA